MSELSLATRFLSSALAELNSKLLPLNCVLFVVVFALLSLYKDMLTLISVFSFWSSASPTDGGTAPELNCDAFAKTKGRQKATQAHKKRTLNTFFLFNSEKLARKMQENGTHLVQMSYESK